MSVPSTFKAHFQLWDTGALPARSISTKNFSYALVCPLFLSSRSQLQPPSDLLLEFFSVLFSL